MHCCSSLMSRSLRELQFVPFCNVSVKNEGTTMPPGFNTPVHGRNKLGMPICNAPLRNRPGHFCGQTILGPTGRCHSHGGGKQPLGNNFGTTPPGSQAINSDPLNRQLTVAQSLTPKLRAAFEQSMNDPAQLSMKVELGLMDANLTRILGMLEGMPSPASWKQLRTVQVQMSLALQANNMPKFRRCLDNLKELIQAGSSQTDLWSEMQTSMIQRAKIAETETKRLAASKAILSIQEAEMMIISIFRIMSAHIADVNLLRDIKDDFVRLMAIPENRMLVATNEDDDDNDDLIEEEELNNG